MSLPLHRPAAAERDHPTWEDAAIRASAVISTHNRSHEAARAIRSLLNQSVVCQVIVTDDASTDDTANELAKEFGDRIELTTSPTRRGSLVHRNRMVAEARGAIIISLDDDAELRSSATVAQVLAQFDHPRVAAVGIPFFDAPSPAHLLHRAPPGDGCFLTDTFLGCAVAIRRDAFLQAGGYDASLEHSGEEPDLAQRWLARGLVVRLGTADVAIHHRSPRRANDRAVRQATRNQIRVPLKHAPMPMLVEELLLIGLYSAMRVARRGHAAAVAQGVAAGVSDARHRDTRVPLTRDLYRLRQRLERERILRRPSTRLQDIEYRLPALAVS